MKLTDILPIEQWIELENEIHARSGLNPSIYDADGVNITGTNTRNALCHKIKTDSKGQALICLPSHQNITREAKKVLSLLSGSVIPAKPTLWSPFMWESPL